MRQTRTVGGSTTNFTWDVSGSLPLLLDDGTHTYLYGPSSAPIAQVDDGTDAIQYLHGDLIGSTRLITNASGTVVGTTEYDPYGNRTNHTGTADTTIGYSGNWTDPTTGLVYLRARDYDTATAQFLTVDPLVDSTKQPYAYVANNPLDSSDPTGQDNSIWDEYWSMELRDISPSIANFVANLNAGYNPWMSAGMAFDPFYSAMDGYTRETKDSENGCSGWQIAGDALEAVGGVAGTMGIATGGAEGVGGLLDLGDEATAQSARTYQTYTKTNPDTGEVYAGRTGGHQLPRANVAARDSGHEYNQSGLVTRCLTSRRAATRRFVVGNNNSSSISAS